VIASKEGNMALKGPLWTPEEEEELRTLILRAKSVEAIARKLGPHAQGNPSQGRHTEASFEASIPDTRGIMNHPPGQCRSTSRTANGRHSKASFDDLRLIPSGLLVLTQRFHLSSMRLPHNPMARTFPFPLMLVSTTIVVGALAVAVSIVAARGAAGWLGAGLALVMLAIAVVDRQHFLIPNSLNAAGLALGVVNSLVLEQEDVGAALADVVLRAAVLALAFFALRLIYARLRGRQGIGLGDVKLAAVAGSWLGWSIMPIAVEIAALSALSDYAVRRYALGRPLRPISRLPFGLYFAPAIWIGWLLQTTILQAW
jgi:leader peptidase (prepilin peptidase)/N-methyltransferase